MSDLRSTKTEADRVEDEATAPTVQVFGPRKAKKKSDNPPMLRHRIHRAQHGARSSKKWEFCTCIVGYGREWQLE